MVEQLTLISELKIRYCAREFDENILDKLKSIAKDSSDFPFLFGEDRFQFERGVEGGATNRLDYMLKYIFGKKNYSRDYIATFNGGIVGYASFWDGTIPFEGKSSSPRVELAFLHPEYQDYVDAFKIKCLDIWLSS